MTINCVHGAWHAVYARKDGAAKFQYDDGRIVHTLFLYHDSN
jgi:hypothetical protein